MITDYDAEGFPGDTRRREAHQQPAACAPRDVAIGIGPELSLSRALLERWQVALRERAGAGTSRLRLVVAGSGNLDGASPPANEAVLLDARTGEVLVRQRKIHPFKPTA
jgi:hypothetical protein